MNKPSHKTNQIFFVLIKIGIVLASLFYIYLQLNENEPMQAHIFSNILRPHIPINYKAILFVLALSLLNWFFDILKWKTLINPIKKIGVFESCRQTLGALTLSLLTPNRIGEYAAKALFYPNQTRKKIIIINGLHNFLQLSITILFGSIGLIIFTKTYHIHLNYTKALIITGCTITATGFFLWIVKKTKFRGVTKLLAFIHSYPKTIIASGFVYSLLRYIIFSFQFYYLLTVFPIDVNYLDIAPAIFSMYLLASVVPSIAIFDFVIKGSLGVFLFSFLKIPPVFILSTTSLMFILNFALPSLVGSFFVLTFKVPKKVLST
ncbi:flippase-like domain-containing protein [Aestuariibaculum sp. TT11]|uniref:Flippase-like domain-containing protein n=1 Tax=Aestuariibaculum sediminum TaxID=2770637 RepID=A0A8J6UBI8_9FLAO|nr:flippase-like domain-containing protein [Aestuariibaculum sediminum]